MTAAAKRFLPLLLVLLLIANGQAGCPVNVTLSPVVQPDTENITGPAAGNVEARGRLIFRCDFAPPPGNPDLLYDVYWYVNDNQVAHFPALTSNAVGLHGRLQEAAWKKVGLGMMVKCSLRARYNETLPPARHFYSDPFYAGLEVKDREITVTEGKLGNVSVRSTVPLHWSVKNGVLRGQMDVYLSKPTSQTPGVICSNAPITDVAFTEDTACKVTGKANKWNEWQTLKVAAVVDAQYTGNRIALLRFTVGSNGHDLKNVWMNHTLLDVKVNILDVDRTLSGKVCQSYNDPHATTADGQHFENQRVGEFVLYDHPNFPFAVHTKYQPCPTGGGITCNCGVAIRSFDSLLVVDKCNGNNNNYGTIFREHIEYRGCDDKHLVLTRDGNTYKVTLPTGTMVTFTVYSWTINPIILNPSLADIELSRGLCGFVSSTTSDDFRLRNGVVTQDSQQFAEDWRVPAADSLFVANPSLNGNFNVPTYCVCETNGSAFTDTANCSLKYPNSQCPQQVTPNLKAFLHRCSGRTKKDLIYSDYVGDGPSGAAPQSRHKRAADSDIVSDPLSFPENVTSAPPQTLEWRDGWTEVSARAHCQQAFTSSAGVELMEEATGFTAIKQTLLESCVLDVKYTAGTYFTQFTVETFKVICKEEVKRNVTLLETEVGRTLVAEIANASCPMDCSGHGTCQEGQCQCDQGYMGVDCSVDRSVAPQSPYIPLRGLCNTRERACQSTPVLAGNLPESGTVFCGFRAFQIREDGVHNSSQRSVTVAEPWTQVQVQCTFPRRLTRRQAQSDVMAEGYMVSVSNDNVTYSTEVAVIIYDAQCLVCSTDNLTCIATGQCDMTTTASPNSTSSATTSAWSTPVTTASTETTPSSVVTSVTPSGTSAISAVASPSSVTSASSTVTSSLSATSTSSVATSSSSVTSTSSTISSLSIVTSTSSALSSLPFVTSVSSMAISPSSVTPALSAISSSSPVTPTSSAISSSLSVNPALPAISSSRPATPTSSAISSPSSVTSTSSDISSSSSVTPTSSAISTSPSVTPTSSVGMSSPSATSTSSAETATSTLERRLDMAFPMPLWKLGRRQK